jgi:hypothetical protein
MKLSPELPARQILNKVRRAPDSGGVHGNRPDAAAKGKAQWPDPPLFRNLALSLGLPRDALSASLLSLAKFFSLPLDTKLLLRLRQQALSLPPAKTPPNSVPEGPDPPLAGQIRSAALAAAAAAGKGVVLSPEALGRYAAALAGEDRESGVPEDMEEGAGQDNRPEEKGAPRFSEPRREGKRVFAERIEGRLPLLGVLNRIPGRDGRRWISLPFSFDSGGVDFKVSLRILVADHKGGAPWMAERMALDIRTGRHRWSFMLENAPGRAGQTFDRAAFGVQPPLKPGAERSLRELLGSVAGKLVMRDSADGAFPEEETDREQWDR